jgi:hypothetical protein
MDVCSYFGLDPVTDNTIQIKYLDEVVGTIQHDNDTIKVLDAAGNITQTIVLQQGYVTLIGIPIRENLIAATTVASCASGIFYSQIIVSSNQWLAMHQEFNAKSATATPK